MERDIFSPSGGVAMIKAKAGDKCYVKVSGGGLERALIGSAPVENVTMSVSAEVQSTRALSGDYLIAVFGERLVPITISGLDLYGVDCLSSGSRSRFLGSADSLLLSNDEDARVDVMFPSCPSMSFRCVLLEIRVEKAANNLQSAKYSLQLAGVRRR